MLLGELEREVESVELVDRLEDETVLLVSPQDEEPAICFSQ